MVTCQNRVIIGLYATFQNDHLCGQIDKGVEKSYWKFGGRVFENFGGGDMINDLYALSRNFAHFWFCGE